jgi:catechol 2,3-dioxygenase-like lactoylglutathione lyase family enzyme
MRSTIRYAHTNLVAGDWERLADFYCQVFDCERVSSPRDHHGPLFEALTGIDRAHARGCHLRLPGHGEHGPTLEVFQFTEPDARPMPSLVRPGLAHLAFEVPDVEAKRAEVKSWGGRDLGQLVTLDIPGAGRLTLIYMCDPEGNIVELQKWHSNLESDPRDEPQ